MWQNERQQCQAIKVLLRGVHLERLWTETGPTGAAVDLLERNGGPLSHGEAVMLRVAFDLWSGCGKAAIGEILSVLDGPNLYAVATLLAELSVSRPDIDTWAAEIEGRES